jgi:hypothetical protein
MGETRVLSNTWNSRIWIEDTPSVDNVKEVKINTRNQFFFFFKFESHKINGIAG